MAQNKTVLIIGMDPNTVDFSKEGFIKGLTPQKVVAQTEAERKRLAELGYNTELGLIDANTQNLEHLSLTLENKKFDVIMIGAGIRNVPSNFILFEKVINIVHQFAPKSKIAFNTNPMDTLAAIQRLGE